MLPYHSQCTKTMEAVKITEETTIIKFKEDVAPNIEKIRGLVVVAMHAVV